MKIGLPDASGRLQTCSLVGTPIATNGFSRNFNRVVFSAAHVVANPFSQGEPSNSASIDWDRTLAYRRYLSGLGLGIAEAMDTAQRGAGLDWPSALELISRTCGELPDAKVFNGAGTDHLAPHDVKTLDDVRNAYLYQIEAIQAAGGRLIIMASRALAHLATGPDDYRRVYSDVLSACDRPVILHWLGEMFDPALQGYWGADNFERACDSCLEIMEEWSDRIDGIKISLLDAKKEISLRRRLPATVKLYTGDDFNYPELIEGDEYGHSHALLGVFDAIAPAAAVAMSKLASGDTAGFRSVLDPTIPLARLIFRAPTQYYKTGLVFLAWLNGFQDHFVMLNGAQSMRPLAYFADIFRLADGCGLLRDPDLAAARMKSLMALYGL